MKNFIFLIVLMWFFGSSMSQETIKLYNVNSESNFNSKVKGLNTYRKISVELRNNGSSEKKISIPCGTYFENGNSNEQSLVVLFEETFTIDAGSVRNVELITACMDASKASPSGHTNWTIENDKGLGDLIRFYHFNRPTIALMTNPEYHSTEEKQQSFLQMAVWAYYDCDEDKIVDFATKYMFEGERELAQEFVSNTLPLIEVFTVFYKNVNR